MRRLDPAVDGVQADVADHRARLRTPRGVADVHVATHRRVFDAATGTPHYSQQRLPKPYNFKASPPVVNDRVYLATEEGDVVVVKAATSSKGWPPTP